MHAGVSTVGRLSRFCAAREHRNGHPFAERYTNTAATDVHPYNNPFANRDDVTNLHARARRLPKAT